jgi:hypothetical protein
MSSPISTPDALSSNCRAAHRRNIAILSCRAFAAAEPTARQTWRVLLGDNGARALCEMPRETIDFDRQTFRDDPRIAAMQWER